MVVTFISWIDNKFIRGLFKRVSLWCDNKHHLLICGQRSLRELADALQLNVKKVDGLKQAIDSSDVIIAVGGDGTILKIVQYSFCPVKPIIGVNYGHLGFITAIKTDEIEKVLSSFENGRHQIDRRYMLEIRSENSSSYSYALNECTLFNGIPLSMLNISMSIGGKNVGTYIADGLIIATSTGSTAYSLSCNGPIVYPNLDVIIVTPISPHTLTHRPLILPGKDKLTFHNKGTQSIGIGIDGQKEKQVINPNSHINIKLASVYIDFVVLDRYIFYESIQTKLLWGKDTRMSY